MQYFYTTQPLGYVFGPGQFSFGSFGMEDRKVAWAVKEGFQQPDEEGDGIVSMLPITDEDLFERRLGDLLQEDPTSYQVMSEEEAIAERDRLRNLAAQREAVRQNTPTTQDIYQAQQLLLLTEINNKLGGIAHV